MFFDYDVLSSPFHVSVVVFSNYYFIFFIEVEPQERLNSDHTRAHLAILFITLTPAPFLVCLSLFSSHSKVKDLSHSLSPSGANTPHSIPILIFILLLLLPPHQLKKFYFFRVSFISFSIFLVSCCVYISLPTYVLQKQVMFLGPGAVYISAFYFVTAVLIWGSLCWILKFMR